MQAGNTVAEPDDFLTVAEAFAASAARWPKHAFLALLPETAAAYGLAPGEWTYAEAQARIAALRAQYAAAGYGHGHRVGLLLDNRPAFFWHWFALNGLGVSVVPINSELRAAELEYLVGHAEIVLAVALPTRHAALRAAAQAAGQPLALMADGDVPPPALTAPPRAGEPITALTECALLYTSGTTGRPKGCILPNRYYLHAGRWYARCGGLAALRLASDEVDGDGALHQERMLTPLPLVHMNAMAYSTLAMVLTGGCLVVLDRFHPGSWWASVRASRATVVHYLGVMPAMLMSAPRPAGGRPPPVGVKELGSGPSFLEKAPPADDDRAHRVRFGFGAGCDRALQAPFEARFGFPLLEAWAMTETGAGAVVIANREPRDVGSNCFGREEADIEVRLVADDGGDAGTDQPGELWVRHAGADPRFGFFAGYLKDDVATAEAWDQGWFHTGDIVKRDAAGQLHFIDRRKNVIRRSGENISAVEVEGVLNQHPEVKASAVAATPDALRGDEVLACIVPHAPLPAGDAAAAEATEALARRIVTHALERLAYYKAPGYVAFVDALPLTASQKIARGELKALAQALPGQPGCIDTRAMKKRTGA